MADLVDLYAEELERRGSKATSLRTIKSYLRTVAVDCGPLQDLTTTQVTEWLDSRRTSDGTAIESSTRWNYISTLNRFYSWAIESGVLSENPIAGIEKPPIETAEKRTITYDELQQAIKTAPEELRCWLILAAYQGLRPQDVAMLEWSDVDLSSDPPTLHVGQAGPGERLLDLNPRTIDVLEDVPEPHKGRIFPSVTPGALGTRINRHLDGLGLSARADDLRTWYKSDDYWRHELSMTEISAPPPGFCEVIKRAIDEYDPEAEEPKILAAAEQRREIVAAFPIEGWPTMTLDSYSLGQPDHPDNFCRWMEFIATDLGSMKGGNAKKHLIYRQSTGDWWYDQNRYASVEEAWDAVRQGFVEALALAERGEWSGIGQIEALRSGPALVNKTLAAYFESQLLPINSQTHLRHLLSALGAREAEDPSLGTTMLNRVLLSSLRQCPELSGWSTKEMERLLYSTSLSPSAIPAPEGPIADVPRFVTQTLEDIGDRLEFRRASEEKARKLLDDHAGHMTEDQARELFKLFNADFSKGKQVQTRFSPAFVGQTANGLVGDLEGFNLWTSRIWNGSDQESLAAAGELLTDRKLLRSAGTSYPTVLCYLKNPDRCAVWLSITDRGLQRLTDYVPARGLGSATLADYERFNHAAMRLMVELEVPPELLDCLLADTARVVETTELPVSTGASVWLFQANPSIFDIDHALSELSEIPWVTRQFEKDIRASDRVYIWRSGPDAGVIATARVLTDPAVMPSDPDDPYIVKPEALTKPELRVRLRIESVLSTVIKRSELREHAVLRDLAVIRFANATNYRISAEEDQALQALMANLRVPALRPEIEERVHLPLPWLQDLLDGLTDKKQVIFYGPPGTGKTYVALALAEEITRDGGEIQIVQFHPSYSYEDFVGGFRPVIDDGAHGVRYDRVDGPLRQMAALAEADASHPYILIVDEINRGNIPKIFGELLFLLEYRTKAARLQYWPEKEFTLPKNLFIIGTMNTADRSIALVDLALRRRFLFFEFSPVDEPVSEVLSRWLKKNDHDDLSARLLDLLNTELTGDDVSIGPSYFMSDPESGPLLERIWLREILPLLEEYKYGTNWDRKRFGLKQMLARLAGPEEVTTTEEPGDQR